MYRFLHAADVHLDSPLLNLDRYDGAPTEVFRSATRRAFDNLVELAIVEKVRFLLIAGDLYDGDCRDFNTPLHFRRRMEELRAHGIRVFIIQGNHDAQSVMRKAFRLQLPDNVHLFRTDRPETFRIEELKVAIHGQGFAQRAIDDDLSADYPEPLRGWLNIGLLHTSCGVYEGHDRYAPSSVAGLTRRGYQYWALGHIHKRENLAGPDPWIIYPGNPQGRHIREAGIKGCILASVADDDRVTVEFRPVDVVRWETVSLDLSDCEDAEAVLAEARGAVEQRVVASPDHPLAVRLELVGATRADGELRRHVNYWDNRLRELMIDHFDERVWVEKIKHQTRISTDLATLELNGLGALVSGIHDTSLASSAIAEISSDFNQLVKQLPTDPRIAEGQLALDDEQLTSTLLADAKELLIGRLLDAGAGE